MKKEINALLESQNERMRLNKFCELHRWQKDALGQDVDRLTVSFNLLNSCHGHVEIKSRDWRGIIAEVQEAQTATFTAAAETLNKELANGYIG